MGEKKIDGYRLNHTLKTGAPKMQTANLTLKKIKETTDEMTSELRRARGIAPDCVADKMDLVQFEWIGELTATLEIWADKGLGMTEGELILAHVNLGMLVECWLRLFYCVFYDDYLKNPRRRRNGQVMEPEKDMRFEDLKQYSTGILWPNAASPQCVWVEKIQRMRNAVHPFTKRSIGTPADFIRDLDEYLRFIEHLYIHMPPINDLISEYLSDMGPCY